VTEVQVYVAVGGGDVLAGTLYSHRRRGLESATFTYTSTYLGTPGAYALDPELPLTSGALQTRVGRALFGALTDCAPDRWGRTLLTRREAALARADGRATRTLGEIDYLLGVRDDLRQGALRFRAGADEFLASDDTGVPALTDLPALLDLAARADSDTADLADLQRLIRVGSSLGGARPKAHVLDNNGRIAIAKFPSANHDTWNVMAWEKVALDLAERSGIDVPPSRLLNLAGRNVLVIDRFDRTSTADRIGYVSAMTMLEASDGDQRSYLEIAEVIENSSARATAELHQLWRRIVLSVLISNTDDHLRNHGFLHERGDVWRLAPAFDLNPNPAPGPKYLSTAIGDADDSASLSSALSVAEYFRLSEAQARATMREVAAAVSRWRHVAGLHQLPASEIAAMEPAFAALANAADA
jgi:serine/threonine-protein kinase HipA